jgi:hypothetical protein
MATVINNPGGSTRETGDGGATLMVVVLVLLIIGALFFTYGLPGRNAGSGTNLNIPDKVDVNVGGGSPAGGTGGNTEGGGGTGGTQY